MANIFFAWELGGGSGHLTRCSPIIHKLHERGHQVFAAFRNLEEASKLVGGSIGLLPAPVKRADCDYEVLPPCTFAHILNNVGFGSPFHLQSLVLAWRTLFELTKPELVVCDHSPTALLASRGLGVRRVVIGTGFCCPPPEPVFPDFRPWERLDPAKLEADERRVLSITNEVLRGIEAPPLDRLSQLYEHVDETILTTYAELDHFPQRQGGQYWGLITDSSGPGIEWPQGTGPKVFAYLKDFPTLSTLLDILQARKWPTVVVGDGLKDDYRRQFECESLHFAREVPGLDRMLREADFAITNGNHGTTAAALLAGKPVMTVPIMLEQYLLADRLRALGAGTAALPNRIDSVVRAIDAVANDQNQKQRAQEFSARYRMLVPSVQLSRLVDRLESQANKD